MGHGILELLLYGLLAGLSALALAATIAVMQAGRLQTLAFGTGFVLGQALTCSAFVIIGVAGSGGLNTNHPWIRASLDVALAIVALGLAAKIRRKPITARKGDTNERTRRILERLGRVHFLTALLAGFVLALAGPKRLVLTALAATAITTAGVGNSSEAVLVVWYVAIATALVWIPVVCFMLLGERTIGLLQRAREEVARRQPQVTVYALLVLAIVLIADALTLLV